MFKRIKDFYQKNAKIILSVLFALSVLPFFVPAPVKKPSPLKGEKFKPELIRVNSIESAMQYIEKSNNLPSEGFDTLQYVMRAEAFVKDRFYHGLSAYPLSENWISVVSARLLWNHFSAIVMPEDILKRSDGICSQQAMVFMTILAEKGISSRYIGWGSNTTIGHFLTEVFYNGSWHLYDVNMEPDWHKIGHEKNRESMEYYAQHQDVLYKAYEHRFSKEEFDDLMAHVKYGEKDIFPAANMRIFHITSKILVYLIPILLGILLVKRILYERRERLKKIKI